VTDARLPLLDEEKAVVGGDVVAIETLANRPRLRGSVAKLRH